MAEYHYPTLSRTLFWISLGLLPALMSAGDQTPGISLDKLVWTTGPDGWESVERVPSNWSYEGSAALALEDFPASNSEPQSKILTLANELETVSKLSIPYDGVQRYHEATIEIQIGARPGKGRGLNWFLQKGQWELRADDTHLFFHNPTTRERTPIGSFNPESLQTIRIDYSMDDQSIVSVTVDGTTPYDFSPFYAPSLATAGNMALYAPTDSDSVILFGGISIYANTETLADLPRWLKPKPSMPDPKTPPQLPMWNPLPYADSLEFRIDPDRLASPAFENSIFFSKKDFRNLENLLNTDSAARSFWERLEDRARSLLKAGHIGLPEDEASRYTYAVRFTAPLALLYAATGEPNLGVLLRQLTFDLAEKPMPFWIHSELRNYNPNWPVGGLETAETGRSLSLTALWARDLFSDDEYAYIMEMIRKKSLDPSLRWLEERGRVQTNNWLAVIGGGSLVTSIVLDEPEAEALCIEVLERWLDLIENDGSYGEPHGYFEYGYSRFFFGWWALGHERGKEMLERRNLQHSLSWMVSYFILADHKDTTSAWRINFGNDDFLTGPHGRTTFTRLVSESLAYAYDDGLGTWISNELIHPQSPMSLFEFAFRLSKAGSKLPAAVSPQEKNLPLAQSFDNGVVVLRSSWDFEKATVFAIRSGGANRTGYAHDRPNRNAFVLFSHGDYLAISPGRSSYRSPLFHEWDNLTTTHNTIAINGENQTSDRHAEVVEFINHPAYVKVSSQARESYASHPDNLLRTVWYIKQIDTFVIEDIVQLKTNGMPTWHILLSNFQNESTLQPDTQSGWKLQRKKANLSFDLWSDHKLMLKEKSGYMHSGYSYYPGDPFEGPDGSAFSLTWSPLNPVQNMRYYSLLIPRPKENSPSVTTRYSPPQYPEWKIVENDEVYQFRLEPDENGKTRIVIEP